MILLVVSNAFMAFAWYGHLKAPLHAACFRNRCELADCVWRVLLSGTSQQNRYEHFTGYQLKVIQECITLVVFAFFAYFYLGEPVRWNYAASFLCILAAVVFAFWGKL